MKTIKNFIKYLKPYSLFAILAPLCMMVEVALDLMQPALMQKMIDIGVANGDFTYVIKTGLLMIGLACVGFMGGFGSGIFSNIAALKFGKDLRQDLFAKVQSLSFGNLDRLETGHIITRLTNDVTQVQDTLGMMLRVVVRAPALMIGSFILAIVSVPSLSPILLVIFPLLVVTIILIIKRAFPVFSKVQKKLDRVNSVMQENLSGMRVVKAFVRTDFEKTRFKAANDDLMQTSISGSRIVNLMMPFMMLFMNLGIVAVLWFGGLQINIGSLQVGQLLAFINYLMRLLSSLMMISMILMRLSRAQASTVRIQEVLNSVPDIPNKASLKHKPTKGRVSFQNVTFSYNGQLDDPVLKAINFTVDPGETIAILGATGSGKTTLIQLIPRFYEATQGQILIDDIDVKNYDKHALRRKIGFALQQTILFSGTIRDNIRYGRPEASDAEVEAAARAAQAHEFIVQSPQGYDTQVGQRGVNLSGGQKQRLAIARALLANPTILILDDSTSAVDVQTESLIQGALKGLMQNRTSFIVAQRISTVLEADRIIILENGRINAIGTHTELIQNNAIYRDIYQSQLGKEGLPHVS